MLAVAAVDGIISKYFIMDTARMPWATRICTLCFPGALVPQLTPGR